MGEGSIGRKWYDVFLLFSAVIAGFSSCAPFWVVHTSLTVILSGWNDSRTCVHPYVCWLSHFIFQRHATFFFAPVSRYKMGLHFMGKSVCLSPINPKNTQSQLALTKFPLSGVWCLHNCSFGHFTQPIQQNLPLSPFSTMQFSTAHEIATYSSAFPPCKSHQYRFYFIKHTWAVHTKTLYSAIYGCAGLVSRHELPLSLCPTTLLNSRSHAIHPKFDGWNYFALAIARLYGNVIQTFGFREVFVWFASVLFGSLLHLH